MTTSVSNIKSIARKASSRYRQLTLKQRYFVNAGIGLLLIIGIYSILLHPASQFRATAQVRFEQEQALLTYMTQHADRIRQINAARQMKTGADTSLLALASNTASEFGLTIQRSEPNPDGRLSVWLSQVEFNQLLTWLNQLSQQYNVQVERLNVSSSDKPAIVEVQVVIK